MSASDLQSITKAAEKVKTDKGDELAGVVQSASKELKKAKAVKDEEGGSPPTSEETKKAESESDPTKAMNAAKKEATESSLSPKEGVESALKKWYDGLSKSAQQTLTKANKIGDLRDLVNIALDDSAKAVEGQVQAAVDIWRDKHEEPLIRSKRFAKKNFDSLKQLIPQIVSAILKKKKENRGHLSSGEISKFVNMTLKK